MFRYRIIFSISFLWVVILANAQDNYAAILKELGVSSVEINYFTDTTHVIFRGKEIRYIHENGLVRSGNVQTKKSNINFENFYNDGKLIEKVEYNLDLERSRKSTLTYDKNNRLKSIKWSDEKRKLVETKISYTRSDQVKSIKVKSWKYFWNVHYSYHKNGTVAEKQFEMNGSMKKYTYNPQGEQISIEEKDEQRFRDEDKERMILYLEHQIRKFISQLKASGITIESMLDLDIYVDCQYLDNGLINKQYLMKEGKLAGVKVFNYSYY